MHSVHCLHYLEGVEVVCTPRLSSDFVHTIFWSGLASAYLLMVQAKYLMTPHIPNRHSIRILQLNWATPMATIEAIRDMTTCASMLQFAMSCLYTKLFENSRLWLRR